MDDMTDRSNIPVPPQPPTTGEVSEWLNFILDHLLERKAILMAALQTLISEHPTIGDGDDFLAGVFTDNIGMGKALIRQVDDAHAEHKRPYREAGLVVDAWRHRFLDTFNEVLVPAQAILLAYSTRKAARARELLGAQADGMKDAELSRTRGDYGTIAHTRTTWTWELEVPGDISKIPHEYLMVDTAAVKAAMKKRDKGGKPIKSIPGIRWVAQQHLGGH